jgi:hypothetical protein
VPRAPQASLKTGVSRQYRKVAAVLLLISGLIAAVQLRETRWASASAGTFSQRLILRPGSQSYGNLTMPAPQKRSSFSVDVVFPESASPVDFGLAYHEVRRNVHISVYQGRRCILDLPNLKPAMQLEDQLDTRHGVRLCDFAVDSGNDITIACELCEGPPWPDSVTIGVSGNQAGYDTTPGRINEATMPLSFGFSGLLACIGLGLCRRPASS